MDTEPLDGFDTSNEMLQYHLCLLSKVDFLNKDKALVASAKALEGEHYFSLTASQKNLVAFFEDIGILGPLDGDRVGKMQSPPQI